MFVANVHGQETINQLAMSIGCKAGEAMSGRAGYGVPGVIGDTFQIKDTLKAAGARFDGENKAWTFTSWSALEAALLQVINNK